MKIAVYPGSFDPLTNGHLDIINRASKLFDHLLVSVIVNPNKKPLFALRERLQILRSVLKNIPLVSVDSFSGLLVHHMQANNASVIVKGLRAVSDFEYEFQMALMNKALFPSVETIFLMTSHEFAFLSSSLVKEVASFGGSVKGLVAPLVEVRLKKKFAPTKHGEAAVRILTPGATKWSRMLHAT